MKSVLNAEQLKKHIIRTADALIVICETKKEGKSLKWILGLLKYIIAHPQERGWQALLNFTGLPYIAISPRPPGDISKELEDTYYLE